MHMQVRMQMQKQMWDWVAVRSWWVISSVGPCQSGWSWSWSWMKICNWWLAVLGKCVVLVLVTVRDGKNSSWHFPDRQFLTTTIDFNFNTKTQVLALHNQETYNTANTESESDNSTKFTSQFRPDRHPSQRAKTAKSPACHLSKDKHRSNSTAPSRYLAPHNPWLSPINP